MKKKFRHRYRILRSLQEKFDGNRPDAIDTSDIELGYNELVDATKLTEKEVNARSDYLFREEELHVREENFSTTTLFRRKAPRVFMIKNILIAAGRNRGSCFQTI